MRDDKRVYRDSVEANLSGKICSTLAETAYRLLCTKMRDDIEKAVHTVTDFDIDQITRKTINYQKCSKGGIVEACNKEVISVSVTYYDGEKDKSEEKTYELANVLACAAGADMGIGLEFENSTHYFPATETFNAFVKRCKDLNRYSSRMEMLQENSLADRGEQTFERAFEHFADRGNLGEIEADICQTVCLRYITSLKKTKLTDGGKTLR